jgi:hypothetical protein
LGVTLDGSGLLAQPPLVGFVNEISGTDATILWDNGQVSTPIPVDATAPAADCPVLKLSSSSSSLLGQIVRLVLNNASAEFVGVVLWVASVELDPVTPGATQIFCVKSVGPSQAFWLARAIDCEQVEGR